MCLSKKKIESLECLYDSTSLKRSMTTYNLLFKSSYFKNVQGLLLIFSHDSKYEAGLHKINKDI